MASRPRFFAGVLLLACLALAAAHKHRYPSIEQLAPSDLLLDPVCIPKYVTNLVLPPPMPQAVTPVEIASLHEAPATYEEAEAEEEEEEEAAPYEADDEALDVQAADVEAAGSGYYKRSYDGHDGGAHHEGPPRNKYGQVRVRKPKPHSSDHRQWVNPPSSPPRPPRVTQHYHIGVRQIDQQALPVNSTRVGTCPATLGPTTVYAYGPGDSGANNTAYNWPAFTIEAKVDNPTIVKWSNQLVDADGNYLQHILKESIDQTLHWANPEALGGRIDSSPCHDRSSAACATAATNTYTGPVPIVTHVHGASPVFDWSDGYPEAWWLPAANNLAGYNETGTWYNTFQGQYTAQTGKTWTPGSATFHYSNRQRPSTTWYHDHTLGITRTNVYAGLAGFFLVREKFPSLANGPELPGLPYPAYDGVIAQNLVRELPLAIQDRAFTATGQLYYPDYGQNPENALPSPGVLPPRWLPEFSVSNVSISNVTTNFLVWTVNGRTYPRHDVYPDAYRLRILNGCTSRTVQLRFVLSDDPAIDPLSLPATVKSLPFWVVGNEGGWFPQLEQPVTTVEMAPAERLDIVINFPDPRSAKYVYLLNNGPETGVAVYNGTNNGEGLTPFTAQIMRFDVKPLPAGQVARPFDCKQQGKLNAALQEEWKETMPPLPAATTIRRVALMESTTGAGDPIAVLLGTVNDTTSSASPQMWSDPVTIDTALNTPQYWDIINLTPDAHPIHTHNVDFRFLARWQANCTTCVDGTETWQFTENRTAPVTNSDVDPLLAVPCPPNAVGRDPATGLCPVQKETIIVLPGATTRIALQGSPLTGLYVWHCHLVEHEDNEMMNPMCFGAPTYADPLRLGQKMCLGPN